MPEIPFFQDPPYPYLLAGMMAVAGTSIGTLRVVSGILGTLTPLVVFATARRGFGLPVAVVAALLTAGYGPLIFADASLGKEGPAALGAALAFLATAEMCGASGPRRAGIWSGLAGWSWGMVALLRSNALLVAPICSILCWSEPAHRRKLVLIAFLGGVALTIAPVVVVNRAVSRPREWILTTWQAGPNFYIGNGPEATGVYEPPAFVEPNPAREADDFAVEARRRAGRPLSYGEISRYWMNAGFHRWRDAPWASVQLLGKKFGLILHDTEIPDNQDPNLIRVVAEPILGSGPVSCGILLPLAALGIPAAWRSRFGRWILLTTAAGLGSTAFFFVLGHYRIPWIPGLALLGGTGTVDLARLVVRREIHAVALRLGLLALPASALAWRHIADPVPGRWGHSLISMAIAEMNEFHLNAAIDALDDVRAMGGGPVRRIEGLLAEGQVHDRMAEMVRAQLATRFPGPRPALNRARWLRQIPEGRGESRRLLDELAGEYGKDPAILRESAAWRLGMTDDPAGRRLALEELKLAVGGPRPDPASAILVDLMNFKYESMKLVNVSRDTPLSRRIRLARAVLEEARP